MMMNCSGPCSREEEYVRKRMELAEKVGTKDFPSSCPEEIMHIPDGYKLWKDFSVAHESCPDNKE